MVPGGRENMLISVRLGVPSLNPDEPLTPLHLDLDEVAAVFPYGMLLPIQTTIGGLTFGSGLLVHIFQLFAADLHIMHVSGRVVPELGDTDDTAVIVAAAISIGYHDPACLDSGSVTGTHQVYSTTDGH
jgi:hypothetical protein